MKCERHVPKLTLKRKRRRRFRLLCVGVSTILSFLVLEILVRVLVGVPLRERLPILHVRANPHRGWEMIANTVHFSYENRVTVNSLGLRGEELGEKTKEETRVFALGDSMVFGQGVASPDTIPAALQKQLCESGCLWRVANGGIRAYSTNQELAVLRELGPEVAPDYVVLFWYWNDIDENSIERIYRRYSEYVNVPFDLDYRVEGWGKIRWQARQLARSSALLMLVHDQWRAMRARSPLQSRVDRHIRKLSKYLDEFQHECKALECDFEFAIIPDPATLVGEHVSDPIVRRVMKLAENKRISVIDLKRPLRSLYAESGQLPIVAFDGHYNREANEVMARAVANVIQTARRRDKTQTDARPRPDRSE